MGAPGEDILLSPKAREKFPFLIECKSRAGIAVYAWLDQRAESEYPPIVFAKANHREPIVILYASEFFKLFKDNNG